MKTKSKKPAVKKRNAAPKTKKGIIRFSIISNNKEKRTNVQILMDRTAIIITSSSAKVKRLSVRITEFSNVREAKSVIRLNEILSVSKGDKVIENASFDEVKKTVDKWSGSWENNTALGSELISKLFM